MDSVRPALDQGRYLIVEGTVQPKIPLQLFVLCKVLRIDTGDLTSICVILNYSETIVARIVYDISSES